MATAVSVTALSFHGAAVAAIIPPTDFDSLVLGNQVTPTISDSFVSPFGNTIGSIVNEVWHSDVYTYVHTVTPGISFFSEFNTAFDVEGFNGVAGYSLSDALAANTAFLINHDPDGTLDWETLDGGNWTSGEEITFFFQSTLPPGLGHYNVINGSVGTAESYAPVPEPGTLALLGLGLAGLMWRAGRPLFRV